MPRCGSCTLLCWPCETATGRFSLGNYFVLRTGTIRMQRDASVPSKAERRLKRNLLVCQVRTVGASRKHGRTRFGRKWGPEIPARVFVGRGRHPHLASIGARRSGPSQSSPARKSNAQLVPHHRLRMAIPLCSRSDSNSCRTVGVCH